MSQRHTVRLGESIDIIAEAHGWGPAALWEHAENQTLRERRKNRNVLEPGDVVVIPDLRVKELPVETGAAHRFRRKGVPWKLRVKLADALGPRKQIPYVLVVEGRELAGKTDDTGLVEQWLPVTARSALLQIGDEEYELRLAHLRPTVTPEGARSRLINLGFVAADAGEDAMREAVARFQRRHELADSGELDDATLAKLESVHGC